MIDLLISSVINLKDSFSQRFAKILSLDLQAFLNYLLYGYWFGEVIFVN